MKIKRSYKFVSAFAVSLMAFFALGSQSAFAATKTWDGGGADNNMNTAANWNADSTAVAGDDLIFPANMPRLTIDNNYTAGTSFNSITFSGLASQDSNYTIAGNAFVVVAGINNTMTRTTGNIGQTISANITLNGSPSSAYDNEQVPAMPRVWLLKASGL